MYTYLLTFGFEPAIDHVILDLCRHFNVCLSQVVSNIWRLVACFHFLVSVAHVDFSLSHLLHIFSLNPFRGSIISMVSQGTRTLVNSEDDHNRIWFDRFITVPTCELIRPEDELISEKWNDKRKGTSSRLDYSFLFSSFLKPFF